jgi:hypothetical protein
MMRRAAVAVALLVAALRGRADAGAVITIEQVGSNVVAVGSGSYDVTDLTIVGVDTVLGGYVEPSAGILQIGGPAPGDYGVEYAGISGPLSLGPGTNGTDTGQPPGGGNPFGVYGSDLLAYTGYVSGQPLMATSIWLNATIGSLGLAPGTYVYTWGSGAHADSLTINIVPEPSSLVMAGVAMAAGVGAWARRRSPGPGIGGGDPSR